MANYWNRIVQLNVSEVVAPAPQFLLQQTAAIVSVGSTATAPGDLTLISTPADLSAILNPAIIISAASWSTGLVTITLATPTEFPIGSTLPIVVSGMTPVAYNGTFTATVAGTTSLTYSLIGDPGVASTLGIFITGYQQSLIAADTTWWANGSSVPYYVFESGPVTLANSLTAIHNYISENPLTIYEWGLLPGFDTEPTLASFMIQYETLDSKVMFFLPCTQSSYNTFSNTWKNTMAVIQSPGATTTELDSIAYMQYITAFNPAPTNRLPPSQYTFLFGVTAYTPLTQTSMTELVNANVNFVSTGAEGGISNTMLVKGVMLDGTPANVKFSIDWVQINMDLLLSNAIINGSNNPLSPLYYNQAGINVLETEAKVVATRAVSSGIAVGAVNTVALDPDTFAANVAAKKYAGQFVINAQPWSTYVAQNPGNYELGIYGGLQAAFTPQYGFTQVIFNLGVVQFI